MGEADEVDGRNLQVGDSTNSTVPGSQQNCGKHERRANGHWYGKNSNRWCNGRPTRKED